MTDTTEINVQGTAPQEQATSLAERWQLRVRGPVLTDIKDGEGRHIGPIREEEHGNRKGGRYAKKPILTASDRKKRRRRKNTSRTNVAYAKYPTSPRSSRF